MSKSLIRKNQLHPDISDLVRDYGSAFFLDPESLVTTGTILQTQINNLGNIYATKISGQFSNRPTVNGTGILLSGEAYSNNNPSGFITGVDLSNYYTKNNPSGYVRGIVNTTYSTLTGLKAANQLVSGQYYRISDFHLTWRNQSINDTGIKSGLAPEPLIVLALSGNRISHEAKSETYPQDTVYYDIDASGSYSWGTINNNNAIPNFKGWIYRRIDHKLNIDIGWDWRNITVNCCRPIVTGISLWTGNVNYSQYSIVRGTNSATTGKLYYSSFNSNSGNNFTNTSWWLPVSDFVEGDVYFSTNESFGFMAYYKNGLLVNLPVNTGTRIQQPTFTSSLTGQGTFSLTDCANIKIEGGYSNVILGNNFFSNTIGNSFNFNTIGNNFFSNTIGNIFNFNTIGNSFFSNTIGNSFSSNTIGNNFNSNTIGNSFDSNTIGNSFNFNTIGNSFSSNTIGNTFNYNAIENSFSSNTIGNSFSSNTIGSFFYFNTIGNTFQPNTIRNNFRMNTSEDNVSIGNVTGATHVYNLYNTRLFKNSNQAVRLSYFNASDQLVVTDPTA